MRYPDLFVVFEKTQQNLKLSSAANYRWRFKGEEAIICEFLVCSLLNILTTMLFVDITQLLYAPLKGQDHNGRSIVTQIKFVSLPYLTEHLAQVA